MSLFDVWITACIALGILVQVFGGGVVIYFAYDRALDGYVKRQARAKLDASIERSKHLEEGLYDAFQTAENAWKEGDD